MLSPCVIRIMACNSSWYLCKKQAVFKEKQRKCYDLNHLCVISSEFRIWSRNVTPKEQKKELMTVLLCVNHKLKYQKAKGLFYRNFKLE